MLKKNDYRSGKDRKVVGGMRIAKQGEDEDCRRDENSWVGILGGCNNVEDG